MVRCGGGGVGIEGGVHGVGGRRTRTPTRKESAGGTCSLSTLPIPLETAYYGFLIYYYATPKSVFWVSILPFLVGDSLTVSSRVVGVEGEEEIEEEQRNLGTPAPMRSGCYLRRKKQFTVLCMPNSSLSSTQHITIHGLGPHRARRHLANPLIPGQANIGLLGPRW